MSWFPHASFSTAIFIVVTRFLRLSVWFGNAVRFRIRIRNMDHVIVNKEVFEIYQNCNFEKTRNKRDKARIVYESLSQRISEKNMKWDYGIDECNRRKKVFEALDTRTKLRQSEVSNWGEKCFVKLIANDPGRHCSSSGSPKVLLSDSICPKTENSILDEILHELEETADHHNVTIYDLLQRLVLRAEHKFPEEEIAADSKIAMPVVAATAMVYNIDLSINQYQELRMTLKDFSFNLPIRNSVDDFKKTLLPPVFSEEIKVYCDVKDMIKQTVKSILDIEGVSPVVDSDQIVVKAKFGLDGSGSHQYRNQIVESTECETSYIGSYWCPLKVEVGSQVLWKNPLPNSILYARPVCLKRAKETREVVSTNFKPFMDELSGLEENPVSLTFNSQSNLMSVNTEISMIDGKMADLLQGDSGAFCHYCRVTREEANSIERIMLGFVIEKDFESIISTWEKLESRELSYENPLRAGQCHEPIVRRNLRFFGNTHQKLRSLDHCLKILYHLSSGQTHTWSETDWHVKDALKKEKEIVIQTIREKTGLLYDKPTQAGGNTNNGYLAEEFFKPKQRDVICSVIHNTKDREKRVRELGIDVMVFEKQAFPWVYITQTVHQMCAHSFELFELNGGGSIAIYAEQSSEAWNKHIRAYKSGAAAKARQSSVKVNLLDIFQRIMIQTYPLIVSHKRKLVCSRCSMLGHTIRSCPLRYHTVADYEQAVVENCFLYTNH